VGSTKQIKDIMLQKVALKYREDIEHLLANANNDKYNIKDTSKPQKQKHQANWMFF